MEKNENGYPSVRNSDTDDRQNTRTELSDLTDHSSHGTENGRVADRNTRDTQNGITEHNAHGTSPRTSDHSDTHESCLNDRPLAYVYAPNQRFRMLYSASDALDHGTLFEELYKPMEVYGRE